MAEAELANLSPAYPQAEPANLTTFDTPSIRSHGCTPEASALAPRLFAMRRRPRLHTQHIAIPGGWRMSVPVIDLRMRIPRASPILFLAALANAPVEWPKEQETLRLKTALYFDCDVAPQGDPAKLFSLDVSFLVYAENDAYQVNFRDPSRILFKNTGWAPKEQFSLARLTADGRLFVWNGVTKKGASTTIEKTVEITPSSSGGAQSRLVLVRFTSEASGGSTAETFTGNCTSLSGKAALEKYQSGEE